MPVHPLEIAQMLIVTLSIASVGTTVTTQKLSRGTHLYEVKARIRSISIFHLPGLHHPNLDLIVEHSLLLLHATILVYGRVIHRTRLKHLPDMIQAVKISTTAIQILPKRRFQTSLSLPRQCARSIPPSIGTKSSVKERSNGRRVGLLVGLRAARELGLQEPRQ